MTGLASKSEGKVYLYHWNSTTKNLLDNNKYLAINIDYRYDTSLEISGMGRNNRDMTYTLNECGFTMWDGFSGCFTITFRDCNFDVEKDRTDYHGNYQIVIDGNNAGYGGHYSTTVTDKVCTDDINLVTFCITPNYCVNNSKLWAFNEMNVKMSSYKSMSYSRLNGTTRGQLVVTCSGDYSCNNDIFFVCVYFYWTQNDMVCCT